MDDLLDLSWSEPSKKPAAGNAGGMAGSSFDMLSRPKGANYYSGASTPAAASKPASARGSSANLAALGGGAGGAAAGLGSGLRQSATATPARTASPAAPTPAPASSASADAFSDLLGMSGAGGGNKNLSMAERQAQLAAQKAKEAEEERQRWGDGAFWDQLGGGSGGSAVGTAATAGVAAPKPASALAAALQPTPSATSSRPSSTAPTGKAKSAGTFWDDNDDDLLGGGKAKPASPAPAAPAVSKPVPAKTAAAGSFWDDDLLNGSSGAKQDNNIGWDDDDAAGLLGSGGGSSAAQNKPADPWDFDALATSVPATSAPVPDADDDDLLGELGRPARSRPRSPETRGSRPTSSRGAGATAATRSASPPPHIIGQIVEMGFAPDRARAALAATESGEDVQAALEMLLGSRGGTPAARGGYGDEGEDDDDEDGYARERAAEARYAEEERGEEARRARHAARRRGPNRDAIRPRTEEERDRDRDRDRDGSGADDLAEHADRLMAQASEIGSSMLSKASMFWSQGKEKALKVYEEQRRALEAQQSAARRKPPPTDGRPRWMVEAEEAERGGRDGGDMPPSAEFGDDALGFHDSDDEGGVPPPARAAPPAAPAPPSNAARVRADEPKKPYVSPFRHAKGRGSPAPAPAASVARSATPVRPPTPRKERALVPASAGQVSTAASHKERGNEHFKLGRFAEAEGAYSAAITALPAGHIHLVPLHNNRAATWLKLGEPARAAADCAVVIDIVGPAYHPNKEVPLPPDVGVRLGDALVKATAKRAQAHEMGEKWKLALEDWEKVLGYDAALGGGAGIKAQASDGIRRAKAMLTGGTAGSASQSSSGGVGRSSTAPPRDARPKPKPKPRLAASRPADVASSAAVSELRAAAAAAEAEDEQRAALKDSVEERLGAWKAGKETNVRALLASLDTVLWDAVLVRVGMHELVTPKQVKIKYMKVIARLHPDKLASATVEQKMLANGVFGTLSEAYTAFNNGN